MSRSEASVEEHHGRGRTAGTSLDAAAHLWRRARPVCGCARCPGWVWSAAARSTSSSATLPSVSRSPAHGRTGAPASAAGAVQAAAAHAWGRVTLVLLVAGLGAYALTQLIEAVFRPVTRGKRDRQVASACGVVVGVFAVLGLLPEHRLASGGDSSARRQRSRSSDRTLTSPRSCCEQDGAGCSWSWLACLPWRPAWRWVVGRFGSTSGSGSPQSTCPGRWP